MNIEQAKELVISAINNALEDKVEITGDMQLMVVVFLILKKEVAVPKIWLMSTDLSLIGRQKQRCQSHAACSEVWLHLQRGCKSIGGLVIVTVASRGCALNNRTSH